MTGQACGGSNMEAKTQEQIDLAAAASKLEWLRRKLDRQSRLRELNSTSEEDYEDAKQAVEQQQFEVERCRLKVVKASETT